ncbi:MAG: Uma2 family endonuclease [Gammaproteobacteria bacterium]|nr:Uma2 family endonuclease [Gammaproteobacteria bacterium]
MSYAKFVGTPTPTRADFATARECGRWRLAHLRFESSALWYVPTMQHPTSPTGRVGGAAATARTGAAIAPRPPLSVVHARALYRAVPPVECDDDGYPFKDSARVESTRHFDARAHLVHVVRVRYAERKDVFAAADMGLYFERGNRRALVVPDGMVVFGIDNHPDLSYKLWEHLKAPDLVLEVLSKYTWRKDVYD